MTYERHSSPIRVSIVVPVYNEAEDIAACLRAIARQTVMPYEVIVVDNNSTDNTVVIALQYPFVRIIAAPKQGVVHARNAGFDAAGGDIIGRIDADSRIAEDWVETVATVFRMHPERQAISGSLRYYDIACQRLINAFDGRIRAWLGRRTAGAVYLLGANMAIQRTAWRKVRTHACKRRGMHEDLDLAAHMALDKLHVAYEPTLVSGVSGRRAGNSLIEFLRYLWSMPDTYRHHRLWQRVHFYPVILLVATFHFFLRSIYRGYDTEQRRFRWRLLVASAGIRRVNPATFVD